MCVHTCTHYPWVLNVFLVGIVLNRLCFLVFSCVFLFDGEILLELYCEFALCVCLKCFWTCSLFLCTGLLVLSKDCLIAILCTLVHTLTTLRPPPYTKSHPNYPQASTPLPESICSDDLRHSVVLSPMAGNITANNQINEDITMPS